MNPLAPEALDALVFPAPFLALDLDVVEQSHAALRRALPQAAIHYAVKCNPEPAVIGRLHELGAGFEIASAAEVKLLGSLGLPGRDMLYSNPVKPSCQIAAAWRHGIDRFAVDSRGELEKLAAHAPGARVYVRLDAADPSCRVPLAGKFGIDAATALDLLLEARSLGLVAHGLTFHVGSQALDPGAFGRAIELCGRVMRAATAHGLRLELLDLGGGLPARYRDPVPALAAFAAAIEQAVERLPYPVALALEPGRALVAEAGVLVTTVIGVADRLGRRWVHLDVGAFNGMMETLETRRTLVYPLAWQAGTTPRRLGRCAVTGPTCDSEDTLFADVELPVDLREGDRLYIGTAGAYTTAYASRFNGFDIPRTHLVGASREASATPATRSCAAAPR
jgi:ornithine decarboxylase